MIKYEENIVRLCLKTFCSLFAKDESTLDTDTMSYEELLQLEDKVGYVTPGLKSHEKQHLPTRTYDKSTDLRQSQDSSKCLICQVTLQLKNCDLFDDICKV